MNRLTIDFHTLDDGYATTKGTAYIDEKYFVTKTGRGEFDVLSKISKFYTDYVIESVLGSAWSSGEDMDALESHIERLMKGQAGE